MMSREMAAPTPALALVMKEFILPRLKRFEVLLAMGLSPDTSAETRRLWSFCSLGQLMVFALSRPVAEHIFGRSLNRSRFADAAARHVSDGIIRSLHFKTPGRVRTA